MKLRSESVENGDFSGLADEFNLKRQLRRMEMAQMPQSTKDFELVGGATLARSGSAPTTQKTT
jgi:hypothetical protein